MRTQSLFRAMLLVLGLFAISAPSYAHWDIGVSVGFAPPPLPVYVQPPCPGAGYLWTPGYWAYDGEDEDGYYWVPGTWVLAPSPGLLWTPGYWGADGAYFVWHSGYWGPQVGFYGGINYGFGYFGIGFAGGYWHDRDFYYNRAVSNITNVSITNVYNNTIVNNSVTNSRVSYHGGPQGTRVRPTRTEEAAARAPHFGATNDQRRHESVAQSTPSLRVAQNHGIPPIAATPRPAAFAARGLTAARGSVGAAPCASRNALQGHADVPASRAPESAFAASGAGWPVRYQPQHAASPAPSDRPPLVSRGAQFASARSGTTPASPTHATGRPGPDYQSRPGTRFAYAGSAAGRPAIASRGDVRQPVASDTRNYAYPAALASAPRSSPAYQYAAHESPRSAYTQRAAVSPRESWHGPPVQASHPATNQPMPRSINVPHAGNQKYGDAHGSRQPWHA
jgi:hypothetical protein